VTLEVDAQTDMTWVVIDDPIPSGAAILGSGLGRDAGSLTAGEKRAGWAWPAFVERTEEAYRAYYEFVPKGKFTLEYTVRLNNRAGSTFRRRASRRSTRRRCSAKARTRACR
jgi:uncharacterized protein YfaS (alpha-2-macroglobulin family)